MFGSYPSASHIHYVMLITNTSNIRDVIAFPKTQSATCLLTEAPSKVDNAQLDELKIQSTVIEEV